MVIFCKMFGTSLFRVADIDIGWAIPFAMAALHLSYLTGDTGQEQKPETTVEPTEASQKPDEEDVETPATPTEAAIPEATCLPTAELLHRQQQQQSAPQPATAQNTENWDVGAAPQKPEEYPAVKEESWEEPEETQEETQGSSDDEDWDSGSDDVEPPETYPAV